jgi:hypothetical protein
MDPIRKFSSTFRRCSPSLLSYLVSHSQSLALALSATDCTLLFSSIGYDDLLYRCEAAVGNTDFASLGVGTHEI